MTKEQFLLLAKSYFCTDRVEVQDYFENIPALLVSHNDGSVDYEGIVFQKNFEPSFLLYVDRLFVNSVELGQNISQFGFQSIFDGSRTLRFQSGCLLTGKSLSQAVDYLKKGFSYLTLNNLSEVINFDILPRLEKIQNVEVPVPVTFVEPFSGRIDDVVCQSFQGVVMSGECQFLGLSNDGSVLVSGFLANKY